MLPSKFQGSSINKGIFISHNEQPSKSQFTHKEFGLVYMYFNLLVCTQGIKMPPIIGYAPQMYHN